jgi:threonine/homoserine/homoserine lactone efflux protein
VPLNEGLAGYVLAALALSGSPGPANLALAAACAAFGFGRSLRLSAGIVVGVLAVMLLSASGLVGLILAQPALGPAVKIAAAAYMLWLAFVIAAAPPLGLGGPAGRPPSFGAGLFLAFGNPKAYAAMSALSTGFTLAAGRPALDLTLKLLVLFAVLCVVGVSWLLLGAAMTRYIRRPWAGRAVNIAFAILLVASVAFAFLD